MRLLMGEELRLTSDAGIDGSPAWSADGSRIAFARWAGHGNYFGSIYTLTVDGSNPVLHINGGVGSANRIGGLGTPAWSPNGSLLAITRGDAIYSGEILLADESGRLSAPIAPMAAFPAWSPDGSRIAYVGLSGDDGYQTLHVMNANGSDKAELLPSDGAGLERPTWSPDGQQIAFSRCNAGDCQIWVIAADGSDRRQLTYVSGNATGPSWSPDGSSIAFTLWDPVTRAPRIAIVLAGGGGLELLWDGHSPVWRPQRP